MKQGTTREGLPRLDASESVVRSLLPYCRLKPGEVWEDKERGHKVGVLDACVPKDVERIMAGRKARLAICDPPYNINVGRGKSGSLGKVPLNSYLDFSKRWISNAIEALQDDAHLFIWTGADYRHGFEPLPDMMILLREFEEIRPKSLITVRNQRGYGTQRNWMWVRQEILHYEKGSPTFNVEADYTDIPRVLRGYYKVVNGKLRENGERSRSECIRAGNVWIDIQQVFYRMEENVAGCYAQKPLKATERLMRCGSREGELVADLFAHSGTTLIAGERIGRRVYTFDVDPVFAEVSIRRLEHFRATGKTGWQWRSPFPEFEQKREPEGGPV